MPSQARIDFSGMSLPRAWNVLVDEDWIPIGIEQHQAGGSGRRLVGLGRQRESLALESLLNDADVVEGRHRGGVSVPAWIERQDVPVEHALEQTDGAGLVLENQPVLRLVAAEHPKAELFVKGARRGDVLDREADR